MTGKVRAPMRLGVCMLGTGALALGLAACGGGSSDSSSTSGGGSSTGSSAAGTGNKTLVMLDTSVAPSLDNDGASAADPALQQGIENTREPLLRYPARSNGKGVLVPNYKVTAGQYEPDLATSWTKKGLTWTFKLRKGVKSCAGNTMTADDVVYTFARAKSVSGASPVSWFLGFVSGIFGPEATAKGAPASAKQLNGEVKKIDPYTVQFKQKNPNELFPRVLEIFPLYIFDSKVMKKNATSSDPWSHKYLDTKGSPGFGPYCLDKWTKGSEMQFSANPNYWRGKGEFGKAIVRSVPSDSDRVAAISSGQGDVATSLTPKAAQQVAGTGQSAVLSWQNNKILGLGINYAYPPFNKPQGKYVRQAIAYAIPYDQIVKNSYLGQAKKWDGLIESTYFGFSPVTTYSTNLDKAKQAMAKAGYPDGKGLPKSPAFTLNYVAERSTLLEPIATSIKTALSQIGINITLAPISQSEEATRELVKFDMGMYLRDYNRPLGPDVGYAALLWYVSAKSGGLEHSENENLPKFDALFAKSQTTVGAERGAVLKQMQELLMDELPVVPIAEVQSQLAVGKGIENWRGQGYDLVNFWYLRSAPS